MKAERDEVLKNIFPEDLGHYRDILERAFDFALGYLEKGRPGFDIPHTIAVIYHAGRLANVHQVDPLVLVMAAVLHDIGYYGEFELSEAVGLEGIMDKKAKHMVAGGIMARNFLFGDQIGDEMTVEQKEMVVHLVEVHDKIKELSTDEELVLMKADSLGAIDIGWVLPTFTGDEALRYLEGHGLLRRSLFEERLGADDYDELVIAFRKFISERDGVS